MTYRELCQQYDIIDHSGDSVGDGWVPILEEAFQKLFAIGWNGHVGQIKEKFGTLRFYLDYTPEGTSEELCKAWENIASEAEDKSYTTCELCGATGERCSASGTWILTLCRPCFDKRVEHFREQYPLTAGYSWYGESKEGK